MKVQTNFIFSSDSGNRYLQNIKDNVLVYLHPDIEKHLHSERQNESREDDYYYRKINFLQKYLSADYDMGKNYSGKLTSSFVENNIINTKQITFELTDACNLNCEYCGYGKLYSDYDKRDNKFLKWELAKSLLDYLIILWKSEKYPSLNKDIAIGFYGGEPLLNITLIKKIILYLEEQKLPHINFKYVMTTNGVLLNKYIDYLVEKNVRISVSLDGDRKNNSYRVAHDGNESFPRIYKNLLHIKDKYPDFFESNINFLSVLHSKNTMSEIYMFFQKQFNKKSFISEVNSNGIRQDKLSEYNQIYRNKQESLNNAENYNEMKEDLFIGIPENYDVMYYLHNYSGNVVRNYDHFFVDTEDILYLPTGTCSPFGKRMFLTVNGKILPCERIGQHFSLGYVDEKGVTLETEKIAEKYNAYYEKIRPMCQACYRLKGCLQCMFHLKGIDDENQTVQCKGFVSKQNFTNYLKRNVSLLEKDSTLYKRILTEVVLEM